LKKKKSEKELLTENYIKNDVICILWQRLSFKQLEGLSSSSVEVLLSSIWWNQDIRGNLPRLK